jgi:hypothetical protein
MTVMGRPASPADSLPMTDAIPQVMIVPYLNVSFAENEQVNGQRPQYSCTVDHKKGTMPRPCDLGPFHR